MLNASSPHRPPIFQRNRYKVCLQEGVPTLLETRSDAGAGGAAPPASAASAGFDSSAKVNPDDATGALSGKEGGVSAPQEELLRPVDGVGVGAAAAAAAAADFGPPMTDAEAASIAGGAFFGFGNDMRVSI